MKTYNKITFFANRYRVNRLKEFRKLAKKYFANTRVPPYLYDREENEMARNIRPEINEMVPIINAYITAAGVPTSFQFIAYNWSSVNVIYEIFNLDKFSAEPSMVMDTVDRAIGVYKNDKANSVIRLFNPLFWFVRFLNYLGALPFALLGNIGFDRYKLANSTFGRVVNIIIRLIAITASIITIYIYREYILSFLKYLVNLF